MILNIYKVNRELPEHLIYNALECINKDDIDPGIYRKSDTIEVSYRRVSDLIEAIHREEIDLEKSDIVEMLPDEYMLNNDLDMEEQCNFLIITSFGAERIAVDKNAVFIELSLEALQEMITL